METKEYFEKVMFFENLPSMVFTPPFGSPVSGGQKPSLSLKKVFRIPPSPFSQRELHILTKPSLLRREGCNRPPVLRTATL
jgi:hypothetical protein